MSSINTHIIQKHDTSTNWASSTYVPLEGEIILYTDLYQLKVGDGTNTVSSLELFYHGAPATDEEIKNRTKDCGIITPSNLLQAGVSWLCGEGKSSDNNEIFTLSDEQKQALWHRIGLDKVYDESSSYNRTGFYFTRIANTATITLSGCKLTSALPGLQERHQACQSICIPVLFVNSSSQITVPGQVWYSPASSNSPTLYYCNDHNSSNATVWSLYTPSSSSTWVLYGSLTYTILYTGEHIEDL